MKKLILLFPFPLLGLGQNCQYNEVVLQLNTGVWASELSWSITDSSGNLIDSTSQAYADSTIYYDTICLLTRNTTLFYIFDDGTVEKRIVIIN